MLSLSNTSHAFNITQTCLVHITRGMWVSYGCSGFLPHKDHTNANIGSNEHTHRFQRAHTSVPTNTHIGSNEHTHRFQRAHTSVPTNTDIGSNEHTYRFQRTHTSVPTSTHIGNEKIIETHIRCANKECLTMSRYR